MRPGCKFASVAYRLRIEATSAEIAGFQIVNSAEMSRPGLCFYSYDNVTDWSIYGYLQFPVGHCDHCNIDFVLFVLTASVVAKVHCVTESNVSYYFRLQIYNLFVQFCCCTFAIRNEYST